jgi:hypothetical protein
VSCRICADRPDLAKRRYTGSVDPDQFMHTLLDHDLFSQLAWVGPRGLR